MKEQIPQSFANTGKISEADSHRFEALYVETPELWFQKAFFGFLAITTLWLSWIALPFTRISFGENLFSIIQTGLVAAFILFFLDEHTRLFDVYVFFCLFHFAWVVVRKYFFDNHWWYSQSYGISLSYLFFSSILNPFLKGRRIPETIYASFIDPAMVILASYLIYDGLDSMIGTFLFVGGVALFFKERMNAFWQRQMVLSKRDMRIMKEAHELEMGKFDTKISFLSGLIKGYRKYNNTVSVNGVKGNGSSIFSGHRKEKVSKEFNELQNNQVL